MARGRLSVLLRKRLAPSTCTCVVPSSARSKHVRPGVLRSSPVTHRKALVRPLATALAARGAGVLAALVQSVWYREGLARYLTDRHGSRYSCKWEFVIVDVLTRNHVTLFVVSLLHQEDLAVTESKQCNEVLRFG